MCPHVKKSEEDNNVCQVSSTTAAGMVIKGV